MRHTVFKMVENKLQEQQKLTLMSLNAIYNPFEVHVKDIREVWKFVHFVSSQIPEPNLPKDELTKTVISMQKDLKDIQMKLRLQ